MSLVVSPLVIAKEAQPTAAIHDHRSLTPTITGHPPPSVIAKEFRFSGTTAAIHAHQSFTPASPDGLPRPLSAVSQ